MKRGAQRQQDERALEMLARRARGESAAQIGRAMGRAQQLVARTTNAIRTADLAHPDPGATPEQIASAYWRAA